MQLNTGSACRSAPVFSETGRPDRLGLRFRFNFQGGAAVCAALVMFVALARSAPAATLQTLVSFDGTNGALPSGDVVLYDGYLYGVTFGNGASVPGTLFRYRLATSAFDKMLSFNNNSSPGANPRVDGVPALAPSGIAVGTTGTVFGTAFGGSAGNAGSLWSYSNPFNTYTTWKSFTDGDAHGVNGYLAPVIVGTSVYMTTRYGGAGGIEGSTVLKLNSGQVSIVADLWTDLGIGRTFTGLTAAGDGRLYGASEFPKTGLGSVVYRIDPTTDNAVTLFDSFDVDPDAAFITGLGARGDYLYGTTTSGGSASQGVLFRYNVFTGDKETLASFTGSVAFASGTLLIDALGNVFGTSGGISALDGEVWRYDAATGQIASLVAFTGDNGDLPAFNGLIADADGVLYGMTYRGGASNLGVLYRITDAGYATNVPEPASLALLALGGLLLARRRQACPRG